MQSHHIKLTSSFLQLSFNLSILLALFYNEPLMEQICGTFTKSPSRLQSQTKIYVFILEACRVIYPILMKLLIKIPLFRHQTQWIMDSLVCKYLIFLLFKGIFIFEQRKFNRFYIHAFFLESLTLFVAVLLDLQKKHSIKQAGELLVIENMIRLSLVYSLTQTFCPQLILYYSVPSLYIFISAQVEQQSNFGLKSSLYVKHDVYRFLFITLIFYGIVSFIQVFSLSFKSLITFLLALHFLLKSLWAYNDSNYTDSSKNLFYGCFIMISCQFGYTFLQMDIQSILPQSRPQLLLGNESWMGMNESLNVS